MKKDCAVAIPIYKQPNTLEKFSLETLFHVLSRHDIYIVKPASLNFIAPGAKNLEFDDSFFISTKTYGSLMVSESFYRQFSPYENVLIYQLDCLVFRDALKEWANKKFDYVAPTILKRTDGFWPDVDIVGVGGFSLRNVDSCLKVLQNLKLPQHAEQRQKLADRINKNGAEDMFWSLQAKNLLPTFKIPDPQTALEFGYESSPYESRRRSKKTPFGCHHWFTLHYFFFYLLILKIPPHRKVYSLLTVCPTLILLHMKDLARRGFEATKRYRRYN